MIVLDTSVVSELMRPAPSRAVVDWLDHQVGGDVWLTAVTLSELLYGVGRLPDGRRKALLAEQVELMIGEDFAGRVAPFDQTAAAHSADIAIARELGGRPISVPDAQIAAICRSHDALLATRNTADFVGTGIRLVDPWTA